MSDIISPSQSMKAVFLEKPGGQLVFRDVKVPLPGPSEVLIKISAAPVNFSDLARIRNAHKNYDLRTFIPGLEGSGTVVGAGKGLLPRLWLGKRVACSSHYPESGTWSEYMVTPATTCFPLSKRVTNEQGSMSLVNPLTALAFFDIVKTGKHKALINNAAASALGRMVELIAGKKNIPVINLVRNQNQVELLRKAGSRHVLDTSDPPFIEKLGLLSRELGATILFDSVCSPQLPFIIEALPEGSSVVIYGNLSGEEHIKIIPGSLVSNDIKISGFFLGSYSKKNGLLKNIINLRKIGQLMSTDLKIKIQGRFPLEKAQEAVDIYLKNMSAGKVILIP